MPLQPRLTCRYIALGLKERPQDSSDAPGGARILPNKRALLKTCAKLSGGSMPAYRHFMLKAHVLPDCARGAVSLLRDVIGVQTGDCLIDTIPKRLGRVLHMGAGAGLN